jgi:hypothetical protein
VPGVGADFPNSAASSPVYRHQPLYRSLQTLRRQSGVQHLTEAIEIINNLEVILYGSLKITSGPQWWSQKFIMYWYLCSSNMALVQKIDSTSPLMLSHPGLT